MIINFLVKSLCEKESVYVNNLGLFRKEYESAQIRDGLITPPGYKVVFDPDFDGNGFAFTMYVSQKGSMLITDATTQIDQWVTQLKTALSNNKSVSFENFGTFALNEKGVITYCCDRIAELNMEYEGMEPVPLNIQKEKTITETEVEEEIKVDTEVNDTVKGAEIAEEKIEKKEEESVNDKESVEEENSDIDTDTDSDSDAEKTKKRHWIIALIIILLLALLAAAAYYFKDQLKELYKQYFGQATETLNEGTPVVTESETIVIDTLVVDSLAFNQDSLDLMEPTDNKEEMIVNETSLPAQNASQLPDGENFFINFEKGKCYVIVGSFLSEKEVRQHIKGRKLESYNPKVVLQPNSKQMRICIGVFDSESAADNFGRSTGLNYWVLK
jgi:hypothetical protein